MALSDRTLPFSAIVGQEQVKLALMASAVHPRLNGVLIRGEKGTAKSTAARALAALLPPLSAIEGCAFRCDPARATSWCGDCRERAATEVLECLPTFETLPMVRGSSAPFSRQ